MRSIPRVSCYTTPHHAPRPCREGERAHPGLVISPPGRPNRVAWGIGNCLLHYIFSANASHLLLLYSECPLAAALSLSTNVAFTALHAQHVAFLAHLERISPFPGPAQAQGYIDMPCYGGGFSFSFFFHLLLDNKTSLNPAQFSYRQDQTTVIYVGNLILIHNTLRIDSIEVSRWAVFA